jgi:two-component system cell cycle sensor histidine kinase/response regulator CckA
VTEITPLRADRELVLQTAPDTGHVVADRGQLEQVLINLALNARDAMGPGGQLTIAVRSIVLGPMLPRGIRRPPGLLGLCVMFEVRDTGMAWTRPRASASSSRFLP